ncbi:GumC family protein [Hansschlegelia quercus]|uniref:Tyrosine-protein kinase G-rich domain-containing protein n=1 Tax=Hansschlegelia quercus TaxID=2528245 RepID=A0A4Q9G9G1_9HYPH|nr:GumC family protein [Hansschlegelia quercus]TBN47312.1 hypothetical protein EYR15_16355 [Hansschlegelia quercus]
MIVSRFGNDDAAPVDPVAAIKAHWRVLAATIALGAATGAIVFAATPNRYVAEAVVALDARKVQVITLDSVVSRLPQDSPVLRTELDLIASRSMAEKVVDRLGLADAAPADKSETSWASWWDSPPPSGGEARSFRAKAVDGLVSRLRVNNDGRSYTIFIYFDAADPAFAAKAVNAYAAVYLEHQIAVQTQATQSASDWLGVKVAELGTKLEASEGAVEDFRRQANLMEANGVTSEGQRLAGINVELAAARSQRAGAEARLSAARDLGPEGLQNASFTEALGSPSIQALRSRAAEIGRDIGEIEAAGASMSADLPAQRIQLAAVRTQIDGEIALVLASLANEVEVARRKEKALETETAKIEAAVARESAGRVQLNKLQREAVANRTIYESFLNRYKQTIEQQGLASPDATLLSSAEVPTRPASPRLLPLLALGMAVGALVGAGLAKLRGGPRPEPSDWSTPQDNLEAYPPWGAEPLKQRLA